MAGRLNFDFDYSSYCNACKNCIWRLTSDLDLEFVKIFYRISNKFVTDVSDDIANVDDNSESVGGSGTPLILLISCVYEQSADGLYFIVGTGI